MESSSCVLGSAEIRGTSGALAPWRRGASPARRLGCGDRSASAGSAVRGTTALAIRSRACSIGPSNAAAAAAHVAPGELSVVERDWCRRAAGSPPAAPAFVVGVVVVAAVGVEVEAVDRRRGPDSAWWRSISVASPRQRGLVATRGRAGGPRAARAAPPWPRARQAPGAVEPPVASTATLATAPAATATAAIRGFAAAVAAACGAAAPAARGGSRRRRAGAGRVARPRARAGRSRGSWGEVGS